MLESVETLLLDLLSIGERDRDLYLVVFLLSLLPFKEYYHKYNII